MSIKYDKSTILFHFNNSNFPKDIVARDLLLHKEIIFSDSSQDPSLNASKKIKYSQYFLIEDESEKKKTFSRGNPNNNKKPVNKSNNNWKKNETEENNESKR